LYSPGLNPRIVWKQCLSCEHVFTEGYYTDDAMRVVFARTQGNQTAGNAMEQNRFVSSRMIEKVLPYASGGIWLDVGFGNGSLLFTAQEYGFTPVGADLRADNVAAMNALGIEAYCSDITGLLLARDCAVISMADVLEHMPYPKRGLLAARKLLREDGILLVSMPNSESVPWRVMTDQGLNPYWGELEHYHNFSRTRLYSLLEEHGFEPVRYGISDRYRLCMEVVAIKRGSPAVRA
jgi:SAM-dependent methyltransferase